MSGKPLQITFSPAAPDIAYVGTRDGIFKALDAGEHLSDVSQGLTSRQVYTTATHPTDPAIAYAGTFQGLYKTVDGGASWVNVFSPSYGIHTPPGLSSRCAGRQAG
jgi:photosystem II stability/assembly factor-like uncharacterized protein